MMNFDPTLALKLANFVQKAESDIVENQYEGYIYCKDTLKDTLDKKKPIGYIASEGNNQNKNYYIIFRGAIWDEAILGPIPLAEVALPGLLPGWGLIIQKFLIAYQGLYLVTPKITLQFNEFITYINNLKGTLYFAGHSLGGALCVLLLTQITNSNILMYNFGCPRMAVDKTGIPDFASKYNDTFVNDNPGNTNPRSFRVANSTDPAIKFPYIENNITDYEYVHIDREIPFTFETGKSLQNHEMSTYIKALENWDNYKDSTP